MKNRMSKILLCASSILLSLSSCTNILSSSSNEDKASSFENSNSDSDNVKSSVNEDSTSEPSSSKNEHVSSESQSSSNQPISSESSDSEAPVSKTATISFGVKTNSNISTSPTDNSYTVSGISLKSIYFSTCYASERGNTDEDSNALKIGSGKKTGSIDITFEKATLVKRVNVYAKQYDGDTAVEYNLSSSANPTGMNITIEASEFTKFSYLYLDNDNDEKSTSISFKANAKGRIYVSKIEMILSDDAGDDSSSSSSSSSSSHPQSSDGSSPSEDPSSSSPSYEPDIDDDGYYQGVNWNATGATLKTSLFNVISKDTKSIGYDGLWSAYEKTDLTNEGYIWDMYSNEKFNPKTDRAGNYKAEGDVYNREHSIPQSKFAGTDSSKMKSDIFHVYPTDGYVNNRRSNYPHGNVSNASYTSKNGSKLGTGNNNGYNGTVFEPIDEYKGDFARTYFYFVTRYQSSIPSMSYDSFAKNTYPSLSSWALKTYLEWNDLDPVSEKEIKRNDAAYLLQNNRNPFIDHPEAVHHIWDGALS